MVTCANCGKEIKESAKHCRYCGIVLNASIEAPIEQQNSADPVSQEAENDLQGSNEDESSLPDQAVSDYESTIKQEVTIPDETEAGIAALPDDEVVGLDERTEIKKIEPLEEMAAESEDSGPAAAPGDENQAVTSVQQAVLNNGNELSAASNQTGDDILQENPALSTMQDEDKTGDMIPFSPLPVGWLLENRFGIKEVLQDDEVENIYSCEDSLCCWSCNSDLPADIDHKYCDQCGANLSDSLVMVQLYETRLQQNDEGHHFSSGGRHYRVVKPETEPRDGKGGYRLSIGYQSDAGMVRDLDEDSILVMDMAALCKTQHTAQVGLFVVADGMGGYDAGDVASRIAVHTLGKSVLEKLFLPLISEKPLEDEEIEKNLVQAVLEANTAVVDMCQEKGLISGSTITGAMVQGSKVYIFNVGDSRTYILQDGKLQQITRDHSLVADLVAAGKIQPDEIYTHEDRNVIKRCLGDEREIEVDVFDCEIGPGDRLLVCCDGLWEMVRDDMLEDKLLERHSPQATSDMLVQLANDAGGEDNISLIIVDFNRVQ